MTSEKLYMRPEQPTSIQQQLRYKKQMLEDELRRINSKKKELENELLNVNIQLGNTPNIA